MNRTRRGSGHAPWYHRLHPVTWVLLVGLAIATASLALRAFRDAGVGRPAPQVQVLNGSGVPELAQRAAAALRARGLDVVQVGNADSQNYTHTLVLQRRGHQGVARQVAGALGSGRVLQQLDATLLVDVTVVLGRDYAGDDAPR
jgi:hypothetical protein